MKLRCERAKPIGGIKERNENRLDPLSQINRVDGQQRNQKQHDEGRQQSQGTAGVEVFQIDGVPLRPLLQENGGNQKPAQDKEDVNAEVTPIRERNAGMKRHHAKHSNSTYTIERGSISELESGI